MALKPRSNTLKTAPCSWGTRNTFAHNIGVSVSATNPEITTAPATAMPNSLNSRPVEPRRNPSGVNTATRAIVVARSEEHTSELQSRLHLVCRLLLEKKKKQNTLGSQRYIRTC